MGKEVAELAITILGSGTGVPHLDRSACAVLVEVAEKRLVFDTGPGTMHRLLEAGVTIFDIDYIFYSHFHPDHTGELVPLLFANKYPGGNRKNPLNLVGGKGFRKFYQGLEQLYGSWVQLAPGLMNIIELGSGTGEGFCADNFQLASAPMTHNPESLGYRITSPEGCSAVYSGDTDYCENLIHLAKDAHVLICESAMPDAMKVSGHLVPSQAGKIAARAGVGKLVLTHFYPECDQADIIKECRTTYGGPLELARDLMRIPVMQH